MVRARPIFMVVDMIKVRVLSGHESVVGKDFVREPLYVIIIVES